MSAHKDRRVGGVSLRTRLTAPVVVVLAALMFAAGAQAYPQGHFACFGTAVHVANPTAPAFQSDPVIANPIPVPCRESSKSASAAATNGNSGAVAVTNAAASTGSTLHEEPVEGDFARSQANVGSVVIVSGATVIKAERLEAEAAFTCQSGSSVPSGSASVGELSINGSAVPITGGPQEISTPAGTLHVDAAYKPASFARYQRALWLEAPGGDIIVGEAAVASIESPCTNGPPPPPPPPPAAMFGCSASALQLTVDFSPYRPFVANPMVGPSPCVDSRASGVGVGLASDLVSMETPYAETAATNPDPLPTSTPYPQGASGRAAGGAASVQIGPISAHVVSASASVTCTGAGTFKLSSSSQVHGLSIGGTPVAVPDSTTPTNIKILGGTLHLNWTEETSNYVEQRAIWFESTFGYDIIVGDAIAGIYTNPC